MTAVVEDTLQARFEAFNRENPDVYTVLVRLAREWVRRTGRKIGIGALYERMRWEIALSTTDLDFKVNNDYRAFYARLIMRRERDLAGMFVTRRSAADDADLVGSFPVSPTDPAP